AQCAHRLLAREDIERGLPQGKVEDRIKFGVNPVPAGAPAHEERRMRGITIEDLADHPHPRILPMQGEAEVADEGARHKLDRVLANAVQPRYPDPPQSVLNLIA